ncbi:MAG: hypothetical protein Q9174_004279, partial [Haloplaca sp. 1 TL-2023]
MNTTMYESFDASTITDDMLQEAATLFSSNYGVWGPEASKYIPFAKAGRPVRMTKDRLRTQCLPRGADCMYAKVTVDGHLAGNVFACRWTYNEQTVCWITQLVVDRNYRQRGLAMGLLSQVKRNTDKVYGIASSHPAACLAAGKALGRGLSSISLNFIKDHAAEIMASSPIDYISGAKLHGSLFNPDVTDNTISSVDTGFHVDHTEPDEALQCVRQEGDWLLGDLVDGCEF